MHRYKDLKFWQLSSVFCKEIYLATNTFPEEEKLEELQNYLSQIIKMMSKFNSTLKI